MKNKFDRLFIALAVFFIAATVYGQAPTKNLNVAGLAKPVTVRRDARSIPYIEAATDADLYFAQGFVTAQDRLWQMDLLRRVARGELAEIFGKQVLEEDKRWRKYGFAGIVEQSLATLDPQLRTALENYSRGVNAYIATLDEKTLPVEFMILQYKPREWRPTDTLVVGKILADGLSSTWQNDVLRAALQKNLPKEKFADIANNVTKDDVILFGKDSVKEQAANTLKNSETIAANPSIAEGSLLAAAEKETGIRKSSLERIGFYAEELAASNNWVISGKRTLDGKAILANDPHLQPAAPGIWYLTHLSTPAMRVAGVTFPGVPGIVLGHNENIAWGATNVGPDVQDLYLETFNAEGKYKTPNGFEMPVVRKEEIKVRKNPLSPETETQVLEVLETRNGVIFTEAEGQKLALKWTARDPLNQEFEAFFYLNRAKNWDDFKSALKKYGGATQNFVYADTTGNIGWYAAGKIPIRRRGEGETPYVGATNDGDWTGFIPFEELPHLYNPPENFIVTANQRIIGTGYKYQQVSRDAALPWRARRIFDLINANAKITVNDVRDIQHDSFNIPLAKFAREIVKAEAASTETLNVLRGWDGRMTADSRGAILTNEIRNCAANKIAESHQPVPSFIVRERLLYWIVAEKTSRWLPAGVSDYAALLKNCDAEARANLAKRFGADETKWIWGNVFQSRFAHPLAVAPLIGGQFAIPPVGINGSGQTPNVGSAVSMRLITTPGNWDETRHTIPLGQSGNPQSPFWKDQFEAWRSGNSAVFPFSGGAVAKAALETTVLSPK